MMNITNLFSWLFEGFGWPSLLISGLVFVLLYMYIKDYNLPPGPIGLPYIGYYPFFGKEIHHQLRQLAKKYGNVSSFRVMGQLFIHLNTIETIKEAHVTQADIFAGRTEKFSFLRFIDDGYSIFTSNGPEWKEVRRFSLQTLKQFGFGRNSLEGPIHEASKNTLDELRNSNGQPCNPLSVLTTHVTSVFTQLMFGGNVYRYEKEVKKLKATVGVFFAEILGPKQFLMGPLFRYLIFPLMPTCKIFKRAKIEYSSEIGKIVADHKRTFDKDNLKDFIDMYLNERRKLKGKGTEMADYFSEKRLIGTLFQFFIDGTDTVAFVICTFLRTLVDNPEVQERIQKELDEVVGSERHPSLDDRKALPYFEATLLEFYRTAVLFPVFAALESSKETTLNGYRIPKGTMTVVNTYSAHRNPSIYPNPDKFEPGRFLGLDGKRIKTELPIVFGVGKRACIGESLANMEMFLFVTAILQNFTLRPPEKQVSKEAGFDAIAQFEMCAIPRNRH